MDNVDLHVHTTASDGTLSPRDVTSMAAMKGLRAIAITDHDTMAGVSEAGEAGALLNVTVIPGIEISTDYGGTEVHVLGYFLDPEAAALGEYETWVREGRRQRVAAMAERLRAKGFPVTMEALEARHPGAVPGRPHLAQLLVERPQAVRLLQAAQPPRAQVPKARRLASRPNRPKRRTRPRPRRSSIRTSRWPRCPVPAHRVARPAPRAEPQPQRLACPCPR